MANMSAGNVVDCGGENRPKTSSKAREAVASIATSLSQSIYIKLETIIKITETITFKRNEKQNK